ARSAGLPGILVLKPQASGRCGGRPFPVSRSGASAPGILRRPRPLKIPFIRLLSDGVSLLSEPRASMARSVLRPLHFLFLVLRAGGHNGVQLGIQIGRASCRERAYKSWSWGTVEDTEKLSIA